MAVIIFTHAFLKWEGEVQRVTPVNYKKRMDPKKHVITMEKAHAFQEIWLQVDVCHVVRVQHP
jgi:hypothetical protein